MAFWKIFSSRKHSKKPGLNDLPFGAIGVNEADGSLFIRKKTEAGAESIVEVAGGAPGTGESHLRAHQIDSPADHPPVPAPNRGKIVATKADTGEIEFLEKGSFDKYFRHSQAFPSDFWMIEHNLSKLPSVTISDTSGNEIEGEVIHIDLNSLTVAFSAPFAGYADLN
jgi:hypothetical protein